MTLEPWAFILCALAAFRVTRFFVFDSLIGAHPDSESRFSQWLDGWAWDENNEDRSWVRGKIAGLLVCPYCCGFWLSCGTLAGWWLGPDWVRWGIVAWAVAGAQALLNATDRSL